MVKSEPKKKPQSGGFFQKFFRKPEKSQKEQRLTVQRSIPYLEMGRDGICRVEEHLYSKTVRFYDINYQLAQNEDKNTIFESWCDFLNYFDAQPGDLIFFEKTYNTVGASHVGIYVGNGMMIHCGDPISYTSINSTYWQSHFLGFGRIN